MCQLTYALATAGTQAQDQTTSETYPAGPFPFPILRNDSVNKACEEAAAEFARTTGANRVNCFVMVQDGPTSPSWKAGGVRELMPTYPGCVTKLAWLPVFAQSLSDRKANWRAYDHLLKPAYTTSTNPEYGEILDLVTGLTNRPGDRTTSGFAKFARARLRAEDLLHQHRLLFPGERHTNKTYPSNSGEVPSGFEKALYEVQWNAGPGPEAGTGRNAMSPLGAAYLMLSLVDGHIPKVPAYEVQHLLCRPALTSEIYGMGAGLPGALPWATKGGCGNEAVNEVVVVYLPATKARVVVAVFTDLHREPFRHHTPLGANMVLAEFMEILIRRLGYWEQEVARSGMFEKKLHATANALDSTTAVFDLAHSPQMRYRILARAIEDSGVRHPWTADVSVEIRGTTQTSAPTGLMIQRANRFNANVTGNGVWQVLAPAVILHPGLDQYLTVALDRPTSFPTSLTLRVQPVVGGP